MNGGECNARLLRRHHHQHDESSTHRVKTCFSPISAYILKCHCLPTARSFSIVCLYLIICESHTRTRTYIHIHTNHPTSWKSCSKFFLAYTQLRVYVCVCVCISENFVYIFCASIQNSQLDLDHPFDRYSCCMYCTHHVDYAWRKIYKCTRLHWIVSMTTKTRHLYAMNKKKVYERKKERGTSDARKCSTLRRRRHA